MASATLLGAYDEMKAVAQPTSQGWQWYQSPIVYMKISSRGSEVIVVSHTVTGEKKIKKCPKPLIGQIILDQIYLHTCGQNISAVPSGITYDGKSMVHPVALSIPHTRGEFLATSTSSTAETLGGGSSAKSVKIILEFWRNVNSFCKFNNEVNTNYYLLAPPYLAFGSDCLTCTAHQKL